jgi:hypothetical protein
MHTCSPPVAALRNWLRDTASNMESYGHLLLEQQAAVDAALVAALRPYFESAHQDARRVFHGDAGIDLHPDADADGVGAHARYPYCLPPSARRGLFGEVIAGLVTQSYEMVGQHVWSIPVFLFRYHADVEAYMFDLARDQARRRQVFGRFGNDFIAVVLDEGGAVTRLMAGEAKWRDTVTPGVMEELMLGKWIDDPSGSERRVRSGKGIWSEMNRGLTVPRGLLQLQRLLQDCAPDEYAAAILSMDRALALRNTMILPRTDLIVVAGDKGGQRRAGTALLPTDSVPSEYVANRDLQVVELVLQGGGTLIDQLYDALWSMDATHAAA